MALGVENLAFIACCLVNLVDLMGMAFVGPVLVPYGHMLGASTVQIGSFNTIRFGFGIFSMLWMPRLADKRGAKFCLMISTVGSGIGYLMQGMSHHFSDCAGQNPCANNGGVYWMMAWRAWSGFFGGTQPVLRSFVTQLSLPDFAVLKFRLTVLFAFAQAGNFALSPIAGVISNYGLHLPWLVSAATALLVLLFSLVFFTDAKEVKRMKEAEVLKMAPAKLEDGKAKDDAPKTDASEVPVYVGPPPGKDKVLLVLVAAYTFLFMTVSALVLLVPMMLTYPAYGMWDDSDVDTSLKNVARGASLVMVPNGIANFFCSTVMFLLISSKIGDQNTMRIGIAIAATCFALYGYGTSAFWHLILLHGCAGAGIGLLVPAVGPTLQRYNAVAHPTCMAQASALPMLGLSAGMVIGPMLTGLLLGEDKERWRLNLTWLIMAFLFLLGAALFEVAFQLIGRHPAIKRLKLTTEQLKMMLESSAEDEAAFIEGTTELIKTMFTPGNPNYRGLRLYSGNAQRFVRRVLSDSVPFFVQDDPEKHFTQIAAWVSKSGTEEEISFFRERFPHMQMPNRDVDVGFGAHIGGGYVQDMTGVMPTPNVRSRAASDVSKKSTLQI